MKKTVYFLTFLLLSCNSKVQELPIYGRKKIIKKKINGILKNQKVNIEYDILGKYLERLNKNQT